MGLFNNISEQVRGGGLFDGLKSEVNKLVGSSVNSVMTGSSYGRFLTEAGNRANVDVSQGIANIANSYVDKGFAIADQFVKDQVHHWLSANSFSFDGIPEKHQYREFIALERARKNHWILEVKSALGGDYSQAINMLATDVDLTPMNISGEKKRVGGAYVDSPTGSEPSELRITTYDDKYGTIKKWFEQHCAAVVARDGTFGVPANYAITITVIHAFVMDADKSNAFANQGLYRPVNYEIQLSRREQSMEEIVLSFTQLDTFMRP